MRGQCGDCPPTCSTAHLGALSLVRPLDREQRAEHFLTVVASDHGSPPRSATQLLTVSVADVNDEAPAFQQQEYSVLLRENSPPGTSLLTLRATDPDLGKTLRGGGVERRWTGAKKTTLRAASPQGPMGK